MKIMESYIVDLFPIDLPYSERKYYILYRHRDLCSYGCSIDAILFERKRSSILSYPHRQKAPTFR